MEYWAYPIRRKGALVGAVVTFLDVTERRRAQLALEESEARYRVLAETSYDAIVVSSNGVLRDANAGFERTFGWKPEEVFGRPIVDFVCDEVRRDLQQRVDEGIEGRYELVGRHRSGRKLTVDATARNVLIDGQPARLTALRDVTEQRELERRVRQTQKMEALGALAGGVAHDFNNLITVITSFTEFVISELDPADPRAADLCEVRKAADTAASLTRQLLAFSRQQMVQPRRIAIESEVQRSVPLLRRVIGEDITIVTHLSAEASVVSIDPGQLEQVLLNLAINARDAMPNGGTLTVETSHATLEESSVDEHWPSVAGRFAVLAVTDTGIGMDETTRARVFEPFFTTKEPGSGTGLGLATVYGIVKQNGGFIWVYSEPGLGSTFKVYLPLIAGDVEQSDARGPTSVERGTESILLVEDATPVRMAIRAALERFGYTVLPVPNGQAALALAANAARSIDLLLTDVVMPEMGGRQLAEQLAALRPGTKVLFMSGYTDDEIMRRGVMDRRSPFLEKPFTPEQLARKIREVLDGKSGREEEQHAD